MSDDISGAGKVTLSYLAKRMAIHDLLTRYFFAIDHGDRALVESCFTEDVDLSINDKKLPPGRDAAIAYMFRDGARPSGTVVAPMHIMHVIGNVTVWLEGERAKSETYAYAHVTRTRDGVSSMRTRGLRYLDDLVCREGEWRIARRRHTVEWERHDTPDAVAENMATRKVGD
jgi:ketosteroid isomerase-like protein